MIRKARSEVRKVKSRYCRDKIIKHRQNLKKCWRILSKINLVAKPQICSLLYEGGQYRIPELKLPEVINDYFVGKTWQIRSDMWTNLKKLFKAHRNPKYFDLDETSQEELLAKLEKLSPYESKQCGGKRLGAPYTRVCVQLPLQDSCSAHTLVDTGAC